MRVATVVTALLLALGANAQRDTVVNPAGNTVVVMYTTDRNGDDTTSTISTIRGAGAGVVPPVLTTPTDPALATAPTTTRQTNTRTATQTQPKGIVGAPTTTYAPMTATTYYYGDGQVGTWRNSFTPAAAATAAVPAGTVQELSAYLNSVSKADPSAASANAAANAANPSGASAGRPAGTNNAASRGATVATWSVVVGAAVGIAAIAF